MAMLHAIWQKVSGKNPTTKTILAPPPSAIDQIKLITPFSTITFLDDASDRLKPLRQLHTQRQIIEVKINGNPQSYQTLIIAIDIERGLLWLDDLFPTQRLLNIGDTITLRHHRNGEQLSFSSPVVAWGDSFGANGLAILLPEQLSYQPRRQNPRCDVSNNPALTVKIRPIGYENSYGNLQDISLGGISLRITGNLLGQLRHGALLPVCELNLSNDLLIRCSARVRAFRMAREPHRCTQISAEFVDMSTERQLQLQQFIYKTTHAQTTTPQQIEQAEFAVGIK